MNGSTTEMLGVFALYVLMVVWLRRNGGQRP